MYFDSDGDATSIADQTLIAKFGAYAAPAPTSSFGNTWALTQGVGHVIVTWDAALPGVFADAAGNEIAIGAADPHDPSLRSVNSTAQPSQIEVDFRFECATSGGCSELDANNQLRMRLHMLEGSAVVYSVPATTTAPPDLCPPVVQKLNFGFAPCFPYAFCDIASVKVAGPGPQTVTAPQLVAPVVAPALSPVQGR